MEMKYQKMLRSKPIPEEYKELLESATNPRKFEQDKWYRMPSDKKRRDFIFWYVGYGCAEIHEKQTHFRITFWPVLRKQGKPLTDEDFEKMSKSNYVSETDIETIDGL